MSLHRFDPCFYFPTLYLDPFRDTVVALKSIILNGMQEIQQTRDTVADHILDPWTALNTK